MRVRPDGGPWQTVVGSDYSGVLPLPGSAATAPTTTAPATPSTTVAPSSDATGKSPADSC